PSPPAPPTAARRPPVPITPPAAPPPEPTHTIEPPLPAGPSSPACCEPHPYNRPNIGVSTSRNRFMSPIPVERRALRRRQRDRVAVLRIRPIDRDRDGIAGHRNRGARNDRWRGHRRGARRHSLQEDLGGAAALQPPRHVLD